MVLSLVGWCPHGDESPLYCYEADFSRLVRLSGLCNCSLTVYRRAGVWMRVFAMFDQVKVGGTEACPDGSARFAAHRVKGKAFMVSPPCLLYNHLLFYGIHAGPPP